MMNTEHESFSELASLYALDLLSEQERIWVEQQAVQCSDLAEELSGYQLAVAAIPYSVAVMPIADDLKIRLFDRLHLDSTFNA